MHIATVTEFTIRLIPAVTALRKAMWDKAKEWVDVVKIGRTHLQDATPLTVGQEWSGYATQIDNATQLVKQSLTGLYSLAMGGTAVGTGINTPANFGERAAAEIARLTGQPFVTAPSKFEAQGSLDAMVAASAALRALAVALMKIANDLRWLGSGPRAGLHELVLPSNEPGSSIMPGKVNPTQEEAMVMVCIQVIGEDNAVAIAGSQGNFELNAMRPIIINNVLHMARILGDMSVKLREYGIEGIELDREKIGKFVDGSLMLVTALSPVIGYDRASKIAHYALDNNLSLNEAALKLGYVNSEKFDQIVQPKKMVGDPRKDLGLSS
jgi:fumarate hydratase class II